LTRLQNFALWPLNDRLSDFFLVFGSAAKQFMAGKSRKIEGAMRNPIFTTGKIVIAITLTFSSVTWADPLAPGKPAGVRAAQMGDKEWMVFGAVGVLAAAVLIANAGSGDHAAVTTQPITVVAPSTT
jgi:hypothetical protein